MPAGAASLPVPGPRSPTAAGKKEEGRRAKVFSRRARRWMHCVGVCAVCLQIAMYY